MQLTFKPYGLMKLAAEAVECWKAGTLPVYGQTEYPAPCFWLVGDEGVYIMHNGVTPEREQGVKHTVVYAEECNPETDPEGWYDNKVASFGGDDGVEIIDAKLVMECALRGLELQVRFEPNGGPIHYRAVKANP
jgi:hypothetical protein